MTELKPWSVTASKTVFKDKWIHVRADDCITAEGAVVAPYYVLDYTDWVQVVAFDEDDQLLLIEQYRHGVGRMSLESPGGVMDAGETDPVETAKRELLEETGFTAADWIYVGRLAANPATNTNFFHIVLANGARKTAEAADDPTERVKVHRIAAKDAVPLLLSGKIMHALHVAGLTMAFHHGGKWKA
ncbi:NUDIX hydrolase [Ensifer sp. OTU672]|uniref:NUDIX hydrolase n=1 Tax=Ensifer sp. OTU672 TaxID=3043861 RepID=UPI00313BC1CC